MAVHPLRQARTLRSSARPLALATLALGAGPSTPGALLGRGGQAVQFPWASPASADQFGAEVLTAAPLPRGARPWHGALPKSLAGPQATTAGTVDRHRAYVVGGLFVSRFQQYVLAHLAGAKWVGGGVGGPYYAAWALFSLPVRGPHEYSATLEYSIAGPACQAPGSPRTPCLLRVDALTVWEPSRPVEELAPNTDRGTLTSYASVSAAAVPSRSITVVLTARQSASLVRQFDALPLGPTASCHEDAVVYQFTLRPAATSGPDFTVTGQTCAAVVEVSMGGRPLHPLYDRGCALLRLVRRFTLVRDPGARGAAVGCRPS